MNYAVKMQLDVRVPAQDGVTLSSDLYLPDTAGSFPTVLIRTPYSNNTDAMIEKGRRLANSSTKTTDKAARPIKTRDTITPPIPTDSTGCSPAVCSFSLQSS